MVNQYDKGKKPSINNPIDEEERLPEMFVEIPINVRKQKILLNALIDGGSSRSIINYEHIIAKEILKEKRNGQLKEESLLPSELYKSMQNYHYIQHIVVYNIIFCNIKTRCFKSTIRYHFQ